MAEIVSVRLGRELREQGVYGQQVGNPERAAGRLDERLRGVSRVGMGPISHENAL